METKTNLVISRDYQEDQTRGCMYVFQGNRSLFNCKSMELPWKENFNNISCIRPGVYPTVKYTRPNGQVVFLLENVPGRSGIEIHPGNYASGEKVDIKGCIMPGLRFIDINKDGHLDVADSKRAMDVLLSLLPDSFNTVIL